MGFGFSKGLQGLETRFVLLKCSVTGLSKRFSTSDCASGNLEMAVGFSKEPGIPERGGTKSFPPKKPKRGGTRGGEQVPPQRDPRVPYMELV